MATKSKRATGSRSYRERGFVQVSVFLSPEEVEIVDRIAERERRKRTNVVANIVANYLKGPEAVKS